MGEVYEVEDLVQGRRCALKRMSHKGRADTSVRFKREFRAVAALRHPNLVRLYELHFEDESLFFTMELIDGESILSALTGLTSVSDTVVVGVDRLPLGETPVSEAASLEPAEFPACSDLDMLRSVLAQILSALEFLHFNGIVHRDLKPDNILIDGNGQVRLLDFGIIKDKNELVETDQKDELVGTLAYMAPEQASDGMNAGPRADLYALGCVLYELLTGEVPFSGHAMKLLMAHQSEVPKPIEERVKGAPEAMRRVCMDLLSKNPDDRPSIEEIRVRLSLERGVNETHLRSVRLPDVFVGREEEMARIQGCLHSAVVDAQVQVVLLEGESGVGKTCLTTAAVDEARGQGFTVLRGRCYEREALPFRAFDQIMDGLALTLSTWSAEDIVDLRHELLIAARVFPVFEIVEERVFRAKASEQTLPKELVKLSRFELRQVAFSCLKKLVRRAQRSAPILMAIDDLQWTDAESMALLGELATSGLGRVVILGMFRPVGVVGEHPLRLLLDSWKGRRDIVKMLLSPLSLEEIGRLMQAAMGAKSQVTQRELGTFINQTGGNPFFAMQLAYMLSREDVQTHISRSTTLPSISELLSLRFADLSVAALLVLELAAAAGGASSAEVLKRASGLRAQDFNEALDSLVIEQMIRPALEDADGLQPGLEVSTFDLYHDKFREVAYENTSSERRSKLHRDLAISLEAEEDPENAEALLRHWGEAGDNDRANAYIPKAAEMAEVKLAFSRAATLHLMVLEVSEDLDWKQRFEKLEHVADLFEFDGQERESIKVWRRAVALVESEISSPKNKSEQRRLTFFMRRALRRLAASLFRVRELGESQRIYQQILAPTKLRLRRSYNKSLLTLGWLQLLLVLFSLLPDRLFRRNPTENDREKMALWDDITNSVGWMWVSVGLEYNARSSLLARRLTDNAIRLNAKVIRAGTMAFAINTSPKVLAWSRREFDKAVVWSERYDVKLGVELVERWRGASYMQDSTLNARRVLIPSVEGYRRQGALRTDDGVWSQGWLILAYEMLGEHKELESLCQVMETYQNAWANAFAFAPRVRSLAQRGGFDEGDRLLAIWEPLLPESVTAEHFWFTLSASFLDMNRGRYEAVIKRHDALYEKARDYGSFLLNFNTSYWLAPYLSSMAGLARRGELSSADQGRAYQLARRLRRRGIVAFRPLGARTQALLSHFSGKAAEAREHHQVALSLSEVCESPYHRFVCLETGRELGLIDDSQAREADELRERFSFIYQDLS